MRDLRMKSWNFPELGDQEDEDLVKQNKKLWPTK